MSIYVYFVRYFSDYKNKWVSTYGVVSGSSISNAVEKLEDIFDAIGDIKIFVPDGHEYGSIISYEDIANIISKNNLTQD